MSTATTEKKKVYTQPPIPHRASSANLLSPVPYGLSSPAQQLALWKSVQFFSLYLSSFLLIIASSNNISSRMYANIISPLLLLTKPPNFHIVAKTQTQLNRRLPDGKKLPWPPFGKQWYAGCTTLIIGNSLKAGISRLPMLLYAHSMRLG